MRFRAIKEQAEGSGKCANLRSKERLEYKKCNDRKCPVPPPRDNLEITVLPCTKPKSTVIMISSAITMGKQRFDTAKRMATYYIQSFQEDEFKDKQSEILVVFYGGPESVVTTQKCSNVQSQPKDFDFEKECDIVTLASHKWSTIGDYSDLIKKIDEFPYEETVQSRPDMALMGILEADSMNAAYAIDIIMFADAFVSSTHQTKLAARKWRQKGRLAWALIDTGVPLEDVKSFRNTALARELGSFRRRQCRNKSHEK